MDALMSPDERCGPAKACGPGIPTLMPSSQITMCERRGQESPVPMGERAKSSKTIVQGISRGRKSNIINGLLCLCPPLCPNPLSAL
jgi:hypothetical protein